MAIEAAKSLSKPSLLKLCLLVSLPLYILDQITKWWIVFNFEYQEVVSVIPNFFNLVRVHNQGVAFGFGNGTPWAPVVFMAVPLIAFTVIIVMWKKNGFEGKLGFTAAPLLISGIIGNLTDRLFQGFFLEGFKEAPFWERLKAGYVVDFLDFKLPLYDKIVPSSGGHWPSFNVADSCIFIAAFCLFFSGIVQAKKESDKDK